jgi:hypothetical protein
MMEDWNNVGCLNSLGQKIILAVKHFIIQAFKH